MKVIIKENGNELSKEAALLIKQRIIAKPNMVLGLASGSTVLGTYQKLVEMHQRGEIDFSGITTFNLDEYLVLPSGHPQSYHSYMWQNFLGKVNIKKENVFIPDGTSSNPNVYCRWYEDEIKKRGGIDLQILGIGRNGHIGFNEPGTDFDSLTRVVDLAETTIKDNARFFESPEQVPKQAITMGIKTIMSAKECLLLASGENKQEAVKKAFKGPISPEMPASILQKHNNLIVILDREAAKGL